MDNNFITEDEHQKHIIKKYEFKSMDKALEAQIAEAIQENGVYTPQENSLGDGVGILQDMLQELLEKNNALAHSLQEVQSQIQSLQSKDSQELIQEAKKSAYEQGSVEGEKRATEALNEQIQSQKQNLVFAIEKLEETLQFSKEKIRALEGELSAIALDLAKEVIIKEVQEESEKIALEIAKELLSPIADAQEIRLKVNPLDLSYLKEKLPQTQQIHFEPDASISRGGVVISSAQGNFDGSILSRYKNLKRNILEEKGL